jgi:hypothetical protein
MSPAGRPPTEFAEEEAARGLTVLAANQGNLAQTARETGISPYHLRKLRQNNYELYDRVCKEIAAGILDKTLYLTDKYLAEIGRRIDEGELVDTKTKDLMVTAAIGIDKINVMTTVRSKFGDVQKKSQELDGMSEEEIWEAIDAEYEVLPEAPQAEEPDDNESLSDTSQDELPVGPSGVPATGSVLHSGGDTG